MPGSEPIVEVQHGGVGRTADAPSKITVKWRGAYNVTSAMKIKNASVIAHSRSFDLSHTNVVNAKVRCLCAQGRPWHNGFDQPQPASGLCRRTIPPSRALFACSQRQS